jgi:hypothetical protein
MPSNRRIDSMTQRQLSREFAVPAFVRGENNIRRLLRAVLVRRAYVVQIERRPIHDQERR